MLELKVPPTVLTYQNNSVGRLLGVGGDERKGGRKEMGIVTAVLGRQRPEISEAHWLSVAAPAGSRFRDLVSSNLETISERQLMLETRGHNGLSTCHSSLRTRVWMPRTHVSVTGM